MGRIYLGELRTAWSAWLGVCLAFTVVTASLVLTVIIGYTGVQALRAATLDFQQSSAWTIGQLVTLIPILFVAVSVLGSSTSLVVDARRGSLARLPLAGATPAQLRRAITVQLAAVSLLSAPLADLIAIGATRPWIALMAHQARTEPGWVSLAPDFAAVPILLTNIFCVAFAVLAGQCQAGAASRIPPVEAFRQAQGGTHGQRLGVGRWATIIAVAALATGSFISVPIQLAQPYKETVSNLMILGFMQVFIWGALLAACAPLLVRPVTRAWTRLVPSTAGAWQIARSSVSARADRLYKSVIPVMFTFAIGIGSLVVISSMMSTVLNSVGRPDLSVPLWDSFVLLFGLPLAIAFAGGIGSLLMMSRQRDAELARASWEPPPASAS
ncbi:MAG: hypothetical protein ACK5H2_11850 [Beutenbergiaceae bacterium]